MLGLFPSLQFWSRVSHSAIPNQEIRSPVDTQHSILCWAHLDKLAAHYQIKYTFYKRCYTAKFWQYLRE